MHAHAASADAARRIDEAAREECTKAPAVPLRRHVQAVVAEHGAARNAPCVGLARYAQANPQVHEVFSSLLQAPGRGYAPTDL